MSEQEPRRSVFVPEQVNRELLPELTIDQYRAVTEVFRVWVTAKARYESRWTDEQAAALAQLDADIWHSSLLHRLLRERKPPLAEPPPLRHSYPDYEAVEGSE